MHWSLSAILYELMLQNSENLLIKPISWEGGESGPTTWDTGSQPLVPRHCPLHLIIPNFLLQTLFAVIIFPIQ